MAGSIPKFQFVCIDSRIRFYSATNTDYHLLPFFRDVASVNDQLHMTVVNTNYCEGNNDVDSNTNDDELPPPSVAKERRKVKNNLHFGDQANSNST